ncbi:LCP family protein [Nocardioides cheoyonin]|uniref:LCP family protein n=1 Tax=Nocardioides cheoyonin TaxID=3156615 RepID=UPI0032B5560A
MADRPRNPGSTPPGGDDAPEYDWLYGKNRGRSGAPSPDPGKAPDPTRPVRRPRADRPAPTAGEESTRVMQTEPRGRAAAPERALPSPGEIAPTPGGPSGPGGPREGTTYGGRGPDWGRIGRGLRRPKRIVQIVLALLLIWIIAIVWTGLSIPHGLNHVAWEPKGARPDDQPGTTYLVVASDSRKGLTKEERKKLSTGNAGGQRTDTIKLLHTGSGPNTLVTIPRDSYVPIPGHGSSKINAAFAWGGPKLLVRTIEQDTGIRIDGYVEIGMGGLVNLVDAVGGITICPKTNMDDKLAGLHVKKGCQDADGVKALAYSRSRHAQKLGDLGRGEAQSEVIGQIGSKIATPATLLNPFRLHGLKDAAGGISVGDGMGTIDVAKFGLAFKSVAGGSALVCGVPISDLYVHWDEARSKKFFGYIIDDKTDDMPKSLCTPSGLPKSITG